MDDSGELDHIGLIAKLLREGTPIEEAVLLANLDPDIAINATDKPE